MEFRWSHPGDRQGVVEALGVGRGSFGWAWWTNEPGTFEAHVEVEPPHRRRGHGSAIFAEVRRRVLESGGTKLVRWVRDDEPGALAFARRHGFRETGLVQQECSLDLRRLSEIGAEDPPGVRIVALSEVDGLGEAFLRELHRLADDGSESSFEGWRDATLRDPGHSPETTWVALDGSTPVGLTFLSRLSDEEFENDFTVVAPTHRRRGLARALKLRAIAWGVRHGVKRFHTSSLIDNAAMRSVNAKLGYVDGAKLYQIECRL